MHLHELVLQKSARVLLFLEHLSFLADLTVFHMCPSLSELAQMFAGPETDGTQKPHFSDLVSAHQLDISVRCTDQVWCVSLLTESGCGGPDEATPLLIRVWNEVLIFFVSHI